MNTNTAPAAARTFRATWTHNGTFRTSGTFVGLDSAEQVAEQIAANRGTSIEVTEVKAPAPAFVPVVVGTGKAVHAADAVAFAEGSRYAVECGAVRYRNTGGNRSNLRAVRGEQITCGKCRKAHGLT